MIPYYKLISRRDKKRSLPVTSGSQFFDHSMVLRLWKGGSVVIGVAHHHPQLHGLGDLSAIWTLDYDADLELTRQKVCPQNITETEWLELHEPISPCW